MNFQQIFEHFFYQSIMKKKTSHQQKTYIENEQKSRFIHSTRTYLSCLSIKTYWLDHSWMKNEIIYRSISLVGAIVIIVYRKIFYTRDLKITIGVSIWNHVHVFFDFACDRKKIFFVLKNEQSLIKKNCHCLRVYYAVLIHLWSKMVYWMYVCYLKCFCKLLRKPKINIYQIASIKHRTISIPFHL